MTRVSPSRPVLWCLAAALMILAGCGSGSATAPSGSASTAGSGTATVSAAAGASSRVATPGSSVAAGGGGHFCQVVRGQVALLQGTEMPALLAGGTPAAWKAYLDKVTAMNQKLVDAAPRQIKASVVTLQQATLAMAATLKAAGYDVKKVNSATLIKTLQSPQRRQATTAVTTYVRTTCGIDLAKISG